MKKVIFGLSLILIIGMTGMASASVVEYDFTNPGLVHPNFATVASAGYVEDGKLVTATATYDLWFTSGHAAEVSIEEHGLGVYNGLCLFSCDSPDIDDGFLGLGADDTLHFSFGGEADLLGLNFGHDGRRDEFDLYVDGVLALEYSETNVGWGLMRP